MLLIFCHTLNQKESRCLKQTLETVKLQRKYAKLRPPSCVESFLPSILMQLCKPNQTSFKKQTKTKQNNSATILSLGSSVCPWTSSSSIPAFSLSTPRLHISRHPLAACRSHYLISPCLQLQCSVPSGDVCGILQKVRRACLNLR